MSTSWQPWNLFARAGFSADFYDEQARVFLRGRLAVDPAVPGPEGFLIDGRTYLYYGPFLSVVRMPFQLFGDLFTAAPRAGVDAHRRRRDVPLGGPPRPLPARVGSSGVTNRRGETAWTSGGPIGLFTAAVAFSPAIFAAGWISVYNETELWAFTLALVAVDADRRSGRQRGSRTTRALIGASAAALACDADPGTDRARRGVRDRRVRHRAGVAHRADRRSAGMRMAAVALVGGLLPLVAHAAVNWAKFGTLFSVPGGRQLLSLQDPCAGRLVRRQQRQLLLAPGS